MFEIVGFVVAGAAGWFGTAFLGRPIRHYLRLRGEVIRDERTLPTSALERRRTHAVLRSPRGASCRASQLRPGLHRYCARLMGSVIDGEDVVQDTFARSFVALHELREVPLLRAWLFRSCTRAATPGDSTMLKSSNLPGLGGVFDF